MAAPAYKSRVRFTTPSAATVNVPVGRWSVTETVDAIDTTTTEGSGFALYLPGVKMADVTLELFWDVTLDPFVLGLAARAVLTEVLLFTDQNLALPTWDIHQLLVTSVTMDAAVHDAIRITVQGKAVGVFVEPDVNVPI